MALKLKPINEQVIVLTGATSGIGLVTARQAAEQGARLVLMARNKEALDKLQQELNTKTRAVVCAGDVSSEDDIGRAVETALDAFGGFDTWINNAGVSIYGKLENVPHKDSRQLFETNFWGVVNGSVAAAKVLRKNGGAIINVGSTLSDRSIPVQGMYCASKHAVKGFTDAFRMELEADDAPISVTLIKPSAIDTPYKFHAKNLIGVLPENPPPVYAPETVAEAILHCAENPVRDVFVGAGGKAISALGHYAPRSTDRIMEATMIEMQKTNKPVDREKEGLYSSNDASLAERGGYSGHVAESSVYTKASLHPFASAAAVAVGVGAAFLVGRRILSDLPSNGAAANAKKRDKLPAAKRKAAAA